MMRQSLLGIAFLWGCGEEDKSPESSSSDPTVDWDEPVDRDGDGAFSDVDCDDSNPDINPSASEICDGVDNDCDGETDEAGAEGETDWYRDEDGDGEGSAGDMVSACDAPDGYVDNSDDCEDSDASIGASATEIPYDGIDQDCDGADLRDVDGDGADSDVVGGTDCDDDDADIYPGAPDTWYDGVDSDCAGDSDFDADADGVDSDAHGGTDCDDASSTTYPGATEVPYDGIDQDCDGADLTDVDGDGVDSDVVGGTDCDDDSADIYPGATDTWYDGVDSDCAGDSDFDADADGFDSDAHGGSDCDDASSTTYPGAGDTYGDGVDADCDALDCEAAVIGTAYFAFCPDDKGTWSAAEAACQTAGYDGLVSILSATEQAAMNTMMADTGLETAEKPWIGLQVADWNTWTDGNPVSYVNWASGEPNGSSTDFCGHMNRDGDGTGTWNDVPCGDTAWSMWCGQR